MEFLKKFLTLFGGKKEKAEIEAVDSGKKKINWAILIPAAIGGAIIVAGTAFLVYKLILKKKNADELEVKEIIDDDFDD